MGAGFLPESSFIDLSASPDNCFLRRSMSSPAGAVRPESITNLPQKIGPSQKDVTAGSE
jgi:hypothetical protein